MEPGVRPAEQQTFSKLTYKAKLDAARARIHQVLADDPFGTSPSDR
ncbi:hypothetical protein [Streptomyces sp. NPDC059165]